jgi:hypothetical protein
VVAHCLRDLGDDADQDEHTEEHPATPRAQGRSGMTPSDYVLLLERVDVGPRWPLVPILAERVQLPDGVQHLLPQVQLTWRIQRPTSVGE